ncbi:MAG TPA: methyl-accepting chemotaxis protein [Gammaproteobacteria bacterium]|nr:methyl-accepting chemotaxis protein [Gammaproteobacteria bacterium]
MFRQFKIGVRITAAFAIIFTLAILGNVVVTLSDSADVVHSAEQRELVSQYNAFTGLVDAKGEIAVMQSELVANLPQVKAAFAERNRVDLLATVEAPYARLRQQYGVKQFQFHLPDATSFLRVHKPGKFGDNLSSFRHTVVQVNKSHQPIHGIEKGVAGLGIRGVVPVESDGRHLGSVEFGLSLGEALLQTFRQRSGVDVTLYVPAGSGFRKYASSWDADIVEDGGTLGAAFNGDAATREVSYQESDYKLYLAPITDFSGKPVAVIELAIDRSQYLEQLAHGRNKAIASGITSLIIGLLVFGWLGRSIVGPLQRAAERMNDIASGEGDLTQRLAARGNDEVTAIANGFNQFASRIQEMVQQVGGSTDALAGAADDLEEVTSTTRDGVQRQRSEIDQVATAMTEMAATVQEVARNAATAAEAARDANEEAGSGKHVVEETIQAINALASEVQSASDVINQLAADSEAIGGVLDVIRGIAEQTNLLALNAAIEAARAGEQGRGFAVVADEVRTLAQRTQTSTQEIQSMIEKVQSGARNAVSVMESGREQAEGSVSKAGEAGSSLETINSAVSAINDMNMQIASAAEEQSAVAEEINRNIVNIGSVADETAEGSNRIASANEDLVRLGGQLQSIVSMFKV